jgi:hypothetical protein
MARLFSDGCGGLVHLRRSPCQPLVNIQKNHESRAQPYVLKSGRFPKFFRAKIFRAKKICAKKISRSKFFIQKN